MKKTIDYTTAIRFVFTELIKKYEKNQTVGCGVNGPYDDPETKVRNLAHLIICTAIEIRVFLNRDLVPILNKMGSELLYLREKNGLYIMRQKAEKDKCNGVIGHAWVIEALVYLYYVLQEKQYIDVAVELAEMHHFDASLCLWERPGIIDGDSIDYTLNHQLWYAASLVELNRIVKSNVFNEQIDLFIGSLSDIFTTSKEGRIHHSIYKRASKTQQMKQCVKKSLDAMKTRFGKPSMEYKENGYHLFNLMALARIYKSGKRNDFFDSKKFKMAISYISQVTFLNGLLTDKVYMDASLQNHISDSNELRVNIYGFPYNVPGFELLYIHQIFDGMIEQAIFSHYIALQFELTYDDKVHMFGNCCHDKNTINYRIYEYYRYLECHCEKIS